jgi:hypothetical protein
MDSALPPKAATLTKFLIHHPSPIIPHHLLIHIFSSSFFLQYISTSEKVQELVGAKVACFDLSCDPWTEILLAATGTKPDLATALTQALIPPSHLVQPSSARFRPSSSTIQDSLFRQLSFF